MGVVPGVYVTAMPAHGFDAVTATANVTETPVSAVCSGSYVPPQMGDASYNYNVEKILLFLFLLGNCTSAHFMDACIDACD